MSDHHTYIVSDLQKSLDDMREERDRWRGVAETLHKKLRENGTLFRCDCPDPACKEMRAYLDTIKVPAIDDSETFTINTETQ